MNRGPYTYSLAGLPAAGGYVIFSLVAYLQYPASFTPVQNWLSDLGNIQANPQGAMYYNLGIIFTALLMALFFLGFSRWLLAAHKVQNLMVLLTQAFGLLGCLAMLLSAVYPINHLAEHRIFSVALYILLGTAFAFSVAALRYLSQVPRWTLALGILVAISDILSGVFHEATLLEWATVALLLGYVLALSIMSLAASENRRKSEFRLL